MVTEIQARAIKVLATRLAELGDTETGKDEIAQADLAYRKAIGGDEWPRIMAIKQKNAMPSD